MSSIIQSYMLNFTWGDSMDVTILEDDKTLSFALNKHFTKQGYKVRMFQTLQDAFASPIKAGIYLVEDKKCEIYTMTVNRSEYILQCLQPAFYVF